MSDRLTPYALRIQAGIESGPQRLSPDAKERLAASQIEFDMVPDTKIVTGEYGECWLFTIALRGYRFSLFMADPAATAEGDNPHPEVTAEYEAIKAATDAGNVVGPYILEYIQMRNGRSFYKLQPAIAPPVLDDNTQEALPF